MRSSRDYLQMFRRLLLRNRGRFSFKDNSCRFCRARCLIRRDGSITAPGKHYVGGSPADNQRSHCSKRKTETTHRPHLSDAAVKYVRVSCVASIDWCLKFPYIFPQFPDQNMKNATIKRFCFKVRKKSSLAYNVSTAELLQIINSSRVCYQSYSHTALHRLNDHPCNSNPLFIIRA